MSAGIFCADAFRLGLGFWPVVPLLLLLLFLGLWLRNPSYGKRWVFGAGVSLFMFLTGWVLTECAWQRVDADWHTGRKTYRGVLQETPVEKPRTYQCRVRVGDRDIFLYLPKDSLASSLKVGDGLFFDARIDSPQNRDSISDFDYATYLYHKGISGTAYVPSSAWKKSAESSSLSWKQKALLFREEMLGRYRDWGIGDGQMPVLAALTLGHKGELDKETREAYSVAGISHVLALSGMHIGIIWLLLDGLLRPMVWIRLRGLRFLLVTFALWAFAFVVGLEASVVRAVVMCMLAELGRLSGRNPLSLQSLSVAAFLMLLYRPFYLFDVGFQLSFVAVASILALYPVFFGCLPAKGRLGRWSWGVVSVSLAAQLGTAPLVMYYFSNFSVYFLLTNLVAAVLVPLIIYATALMMAMTPLPAIQVGVVKVLDGLVMFLNDTAHWASGLPGASFSMPMLGVVEVCAFYLLLFTCRVYWKNRKKQWLIGCLAAFALLLAVHLTALLTR